MLRRRARSAVWVGVGLGLSVWFGLTAVLGVPSCLFAGVTGLPCPTCGLTRATWALLHGNFREAFALHPLVPGVPLALILGGWELLGATTPRATSTERFRVGWRWAACAFFLVALLIVWAARWSGCLGGPVSVRSYRS